MYLSKIHVQYRDGSKASGVRVALGFSHPLGGVTRDAYTDSYGIALIEHLGRGRADVYVSGSRRGSLNAPGETVVFVS